MEFSSFLIISDGDDIIVAGASIFGTDDYQQTITALKAAANSNYSFVTAALAIKARCKPSYFLDIQERNSYNHKQATFVKTMIGNHQGNSHEV